MLFNYISGDPGVINNVLIKKPFLRCPKSSCLMIVFRSNCGFMGLYIENLPHIIFTCSKILSDSIATVRESEQIVVINNVLFFILQYVLIEWMPIDSLLNNILSGISEVKAILN